MPGRRPPPPSLEAASFPFFSKLDESLRRVMQLDIEREVLWNFHPGSGPAIAGLLYVQRPRTRVRHHRGDLRSADASQLVSHRWCSGGFAERLGQLGPRFVKYLPPRLIEYDKEVMKNRIFKARTQGVGAFTTEEAIEWGVTGPNLRACGFEWDFRKKQPYSGYEQFEFDIPTGRHGDCYDRGMVRVEEMRQSLRIVEQCVNNMPEGPYKSAQPLACPPLKARTMHDIETLITHFVGVSWGPVIPPGEALGAIEATKGNNSYYLVSDGGGMSYRTRIRTPSFAHMQMMPRLARGRMIPDLFAILGAMDFVLADVDR